MKFKISVKRPSNDPCETPHTTQPKIRMHPHFLHCDTGWSDVSVNGTSQEQHL